ncbi:alpha-tubulin N-acetyltransferase 1-like [Drosophila guanche]|uniref:Alpha-tubulin N-acetyltransferase n=1 Tax=Drosophila guanche TaxID=7266 RepID=A0A3B0JXF7_DROGU|nr:alpha-tubulin N-acetyltransferase 1-like [Drosophila guanche]SPP78449.1 blast:Alpha-tubulin N-acetyltransferase 1 [Drosophila guanche]
MTRFTFDIKPLFPEAIIKVASDMLPQNFSGTRVQCADATLKMTEILDLMGKKSAVAQELVSQVTTAQRLGRSDNQIVYLMADADDGPNGSVVGLLKVGTKNLYLYDGTGKAHQVKGAPAILDFYVDEKHQRRGLGKQLFETMLTQEGWSPAKLSIDRPSSKMLLFMARHYGLVRTIPQANHFVLYEGYFNDVAPSSPPLQANKSLPAILAAGSNSQSSIGERCANYRKRSTLDYPGNGNLGSKCTMAEIMQNSRGRNNKGNAAGDAQPSRMNLRNN